MKPETRMNKILTSATTPSVKIAQLQTLALRCVASSPMQKTVRAAYTELQSGRNPLDTPALLDWRNHLPQPPA